MQTPLLPIEGKCCVGRRAESEFRSAWSTVQVALTGAAPSFLPVSIARLAASQGRPARRTHVLDGEGESGGHQPGTGTAGKSEFPAGWSDDKIVGEVESVANDPVSTRIVRPDGRTVVEGTRDGVNIRVIVSRDHVTVVTGRPTNMPVNR